MGMPSGSTDAFRTEPPISRNRHRSLLASTKGATAHVATGATERSGEHPRVKEQLTGSLIRLPEDMLCNNRTSDPSGKRKIQRGRRRRPQAPKGRAGEPRQRRGME